MDFLDEWFLSQGKGNPRQQLDSCQNNNNKKNEAQLQCYILTYFDWRAVVSACVWQ